MQVGLAIDLSEMYFVPDAVNEPMLSAAALMALALDHGIQAEKASCLEEQRKLQRVADIYTVLATIDIPMDRLERTAR